MRRLPLVFRVIRDKHSATVHGSQSSATFLSTTRQYLPKARQPLARAGASRCTFCAVLLDLCLLGIQVVDSSVLPEISRLSANQSVILCSGGYH